ncbi:hypothetical protein G7075_11735 [Phycicoccus sp. HDW14]|uniref:YncE family protein n=1 Tax=Phycicoccus sp. HDW14 TaxID=2714941 RepID=UPI001407F656|nr:hypothetical protein [Phycicoccus sp. HDW14]QIM21641.1 hypothetical protein G7075_11735 [Phycicoccus sp. HDW14]
MRLLPQRLLPPMLRRRTGDRGSAEIGVALVAAAVVAGSLVGTGVARTAVEVTDGVTWLADSPTGQVVEINPATLEPQSAALVGLPGQQLVLSQDRGRLVVANRATGALTSIDLATLLASGRRDATPGEAVTVLLDHGRAFLVDRGVGLVASIDPVTLATRGRVWLAPKGLRDATIDGKGSLWVASGDDALTRLTWSDASLTFTSEETHALARIGTTVRLVAHERGVTAVGPGTGAIVQVGTGHDLVSAAPQMRGVIAPAQSSSSTLVPVSVPGRDVVVLVRDGSRVSEVQTGALGCPSPGAPVELHGVVYVPCPTAGRVIRLGGDGSKAGPDILTGKGAPELVVDDGTLLVNVPGSTKGVRVSADGTTTSFVRFDETIKPADVDRDPAKEDKAAQEKARKDREGDRNRPHKDPPRYDPGSGGLPTSTPGGPRPTHTSTRTTTPSSSGSGSEDPPSAPTPAPRAPVITEARATGSGSASVTWTQPGPDATSYDVLVGGAVVTTVSGSTTSTTLTGLATGSTVQITVRGSFAGGRTAVSAPAAVTPAGAPAAPGASPSARPPAAAPRPRSRSPGTPPPTTAAPSPATPSPPTARTGRTPGAGRPARPASPCPATRERRRAGRSASRSPRPTPSAPVRPAPPRPR